MPSCCESIAAVLCKHRTCTQVANCLRFRPDTHTHVLPVLCLGSPARFSVAWFVGSNGVFSLDRATTERPTSELVVIAVSLPNEPDVGKLPQFAARLRNVSRGKYAALGHQTGCQIPPQV